MRNYVSESDICVTPVSDTPLPLPFFRSYCRGANSSPRLIVRLRLFAHFKNTNRELYFEGMHDTGLPISILGVLAILNVLNKKKQKRRTWSKQWLRDRQKYSHMSLLKHLNENNPDDCHNFLRMNDDCFQNLLKAITPFILKKNTPMRESISPEQWLIATLRYLATGRSLQDLKFSTGISPQSLGKIIPETCKTIVIALQQEYIKLPSNPHEWNEVANNFQMHWNFPNCGGAIDGKHIRIVPPPNSGSFFYNYKGFFSIVMLAAVNANYEFMYLDIGKNGRNSDGSIIDQTEFYKRLKEWKFSSNQPHNLT